MSQSKPCPACGAEIPTVALQCEYCGLEIKTTNEEGVNLLKELQTKLYELDNSISAKDKALWGEGNIWNAKASLINSFTLPTTKKDLIDLLLIANSNIQGSSSGPKIYGNPVKQAWRGKAKQAYSMLKLYGSDGDPLVMKILDEYKSLDSSIDKGQNGWLKRLFK